MTKSDIKYILKNKIVVSCRTIEEAEELLNAAHDSNLKWSDGSSYKNLRNWETYKERTLYNLSLGTYGTGFSFDAKNFYIRTIAEIKEKRISIDELEDYLDKLDEFELKVDEIDI